MKSKLAATCLVVGVAVVGAGCDAPPDGGNNPDVDMSNVVVQPTDDAGHVLPPVDMAGTPPSDLSQVSHPPDFSLPGTSNVHIIVEPNGGDMVSAIAGAKKSLHMSMYLMTSSSVQQALISRAGAGVDVKVILNQKFPNGTNDNAGVYSQLQSGGVSVVYAPSQFTYTHTKYFIVDGATAWIMTMNATSSAPTSNREYLAVDTNAADVAEAEQLFAADFANQSYTPAGNLVVANVNARPKLLALVAGATSTIDVEGEEFSDAQVAVAVANKAKSGVKVRVVLANGISTPGQDQVVLTIKNAGGSVVASGATSGAGSSSNPYIHSKAIVVDGTRAYVGSANLSTGSLLYNRELGVIVTNVTEVGKVASAINTDFNRGSPL